MNNMELNPANITYTISTCTSAKVGNKEKHPEVSFDWHTDENNKLINWHYHRFWAVTEGYGHIVTTFGEFDLVKGESYYIPACSVIKTDCSDYMEQLYVDFIPKSIFVSLDYIFDFNYLCTDFTLITELLNKIKNTYTKKDIHSSFITNSAMSSILSCFLKNTKEHLSSSNEFLPVLSFIDKNYKNKITLKILSDITGYTPEYFSILFKRVFGVPPLQFVAKKRMETAKTLLLTTNYNISEIADMCGYPDPLYFTRVFIANFGCPPTTFRNKYI